MWFLFGFITLISFSCYFGFKRFGAKWKGEHSIDEAVSYEYQFVRNKSKTSGFMVGVEAPGEYDFVFKREDSWDRVCKLLGLSVEHQVGSTEFDKLVYVVSNDGHFLNQISENQGIVESVIKLFKLNRFESTLTEVRCQNGRLWATFKVGKLFSGDAELKHLHTVLPHTAKLLAKVAGQLKLNQPSTQGTHRDPFILRAAVVLAISSGLFVNGFVHFLRFFWSTAEFTVDLSRLWMWSACGGVLIVALLLGVTLRILGRSARAHLVLIELIFVGSIGATLTMFTELRDLNMELDTSPVARIRVDVLGKSVTRAKKGGTHYSIKVRDWNQQFTTQEIKVSSAFFHAIKAGEKLEVRQRAGYLGLRWVESYARASGT